MIFVSLGVKQSFQVAPASFNKMKYPSLLVYRNRRLPSVVFSHKACLHNTTTTTNNTATTTASYDSSRVRLYKRGQHPYGTREYWLVPLDCGGDDLVTIKDKIAGLHAHRNIVFGAHLPQNTTNKIDTTTNNVNNNNDTNDFDKMNNQNLDLCLPLLHAALEDMAKAGQGEQPQAISPLYGLSAWIRTCFRESNNNNNNATKETAILSTLQESNPTSYEACRILAFETPSSHLDNVGVWRDAKVGWEMLAREFAQQGHSAHCELYKSIENAELATMEYLAETKPRYLQSAGGVMARYYFL